jgi:hypothetical protein
MYHWQEDIACHKQAFHDALSRAISDVRNDLHHDEVAFVKQYADKRFCWSVRAGQWRDFLTKAAVRKTPQVFYQFK